MKTLKVEGTAGTGKTTFLVERIATLVSQGVDASKILCSTFSKDLSMEIAARLTEQGITKEGKGLWWLGRTTHSIAYARARATNGESAVIEERQVKDFFEQHAIEYKSESDITPEEHELPFYFTHHNILGNQVLNFYHWLRHTKCIRILPESTVTQAQLKDWWNAYSNRHKPAYYELPINLHQTILAYEQYKTEHQLTDFTDMVLNAITITPPPCTHFLFDECQDYSPLLWTLIEYWTSQPTTQEVILAGDPTQSIYEFFGADSRLFQQMQADQKITLTESHRLFKPQDLLLNALIKHAPTVRYDDVRGMRTGKITMNDFVMDSDTLPHLLKNTTEPTLLLANTNYQVRQIGKWLGELGIPYEYANPVQHQQHGWTTQLVNMWNALQKVCSKQPVSHAELKAFAEMVNSKVSLPRQPLFQWSEMVALFGLDTFQITLDTLIQQSDLTDNEKELLLNARCGTIDTIPLTIGTKHSSKGKECHKAVVFLDVSKRSLNDIWYPVGEEQVRLDYVACSRPTHHLVLVHGFFERATLPDYWEEMIACEW